MARFPKGPEMHAAALAPVVSYDVEFHACGWASTWFVYSLRADGQRSIVTLPAKFDPVFLLHAAFPTEERARAFVATLPL